MQMTEDRCLKNKRRIHVSLVFVAFICFLFSGFFSLAAFASEKWSGVDESVVEKIAKDHGREAREPFINTSQGDLLLFVFLLAGAVGGFVAGYSWRKLMESKSQQTENSNKEF
jgi:ABC-type cobalt transport system substrate-binding protein